MDYHTLILAVLAVMVSVTCSPVTTANAADKDGGSDLRLREIPDWIITKDRNDGPGGYWNNQFHKLPPRTAAFIFGNMLHLSPRRCDYPVCTIYLSGSNYLCSGLQAKVADGGATETNVAHVLINGENGKVYDPVARVWRNMGYINKAVGPLAEDVKGKTGRQVLVDLGQPYEANGYDIKRMTLLWSMLLRPNGVSIIDETVPPQRRNMADHKLVRFSQFSDCVAGSPKADLYYWCIEGRVRVQVVADRVVEVQAVNEVGLK